MEEIRSTPELTSAYEGAEEVWQGYRKAHREVITIGRDLIDRDITNIFDVSLFAKAIKRVQVIDNEIKIFETDERR